jgi:Ca2+-binding EF-hand superfamily protein
VPKNFPFLVLSSEKSAAALTAELLTRYDKNKNQELSRKELPLDKSAFDRLDANRDGELDAVELDGWRKLSPELELIVPLERHSRRDILVVPAAQGKPQPLAALTPPKGGGLRIPIAEKQLEVARRNSVSSLRQELLRQFDALAGKKGVLAEKAIYQPPFTFVALARLADRNGDNSLTRKEIDEFLDMQEKFFFRATYLTVMDRGVSLFELLDTDHDGQLSPRELRSAWSRLAPWDRDGSGRIRREQLPRQFQFVLSHGQSRANSTPVGGFGGLPSFRDRSRGPVWFRKMDRNGDGDVSQKEFLGTAEQFRRLDADGDGLIDVNEAESADRELRKKRP